MNSVLADPDMKVHMSLDEIIHLTRAQTSGQLQGRTLRNLKKKKNPRKRELLGPEHSVPLLSTSKGLDIYVSKQSPLLSAENKRRITQAVSNRVVNADLLQKTKEIIPAEYKLIKTDQGVERVLVPATNFFLKPQKKKLLQPRKLNKTNSIGLDTAHAPVFDAPPPLVAAPILQPPTLPDEDMKMEDVEPEVVVIDPPNNEKHFEVIDVEPDVPVDFVESRKLVLASMAVPYSCGKTLNDRFTMLTENFQV